MKDRLIRTLAVSSLALMGAVVSAAWGALPSFETPRQVAQDLDDFVQPRFQSEGVGVFSHGGFLAARTATEKTLLSHAKQINREYAVYFLHCMPPPHSAHRGNEKLSLKLLARGGVSSHVMALPVSDLAPTTETALPALKQGKPTETVVGQWLVSIRPVKASSKSCLSCHVHSKLNDTLGAMVYAVNVTEDRAK